MSEDILSQLVALSNTLGRPELDYAILGEGNTSARADADSFYVKTSGTELRTITAQGFVRISFERARALLASAGLTDADVKAGLAAAKVDPATPGHPSVETLLHALCLDLPGINFVGHTHPTAVNRLTCSTGFEAAFAGRLFPDEIVVCGVAPLLVPYTDPGVPLARKVGELIAGYLDRYAEPPKVILMQNHGLIALGKSARQVEDVTAMMVKTCRVLRGAFAAGGPRFLSQKDVDRIHTRPDELYRRQQLGLEGKK
jgi:rhamnose utilization protein RhaD (predicted bifunctional aldolase and dehydrogenase)